MLTAKERFSSIRDKYQAGANKANFLIISRPGMGKTHLLKTCPGPVLVHSFDPGGTRTLKAEIDRGEVLVETFEGDDAKKPTMYKAWEKRVNEHAKSGFFDYFGTYAIDSATTWIQDLFNYQVSRPTKSNAMGRAGEPPELQDHNFVQTYIRNVLTQITSLPCNVVLTAHLDIFSDPTDGKVHTALLAAGKLKTQIPLLFDEVYVLLAEKSPKGIHRYLLTEIDGKHEARTRLGTSGILPKHAEPDISAILSTCGIHREPKPLAD